MKTKRRDATISVLSVGAEVRARREGLKLNQAAAARRLKMDRGRLSAIENDRAGVRVTVTEARRLLTVLGVPLEVWA